MQNVLGLRKHVKLFDENASARDVVSWTVMIAGYAQNGMGEEVH
jgi:hypothetical protein